MSGIYGWNSGNSFMNSFFGTGGSGSGPSLLSSLGDLQMIKSGAYKKAMKAYYANQVSQSKTDGKDTDTISGSGTADSKVKLSNLKSSAQKLYESANALKNADYSKDARPEDLLSKAKSFIDSYNSTLSTTKNMNSYSILQTAVWGTEQMNISEGLLNKVGISIGENNSLSIDEEKFKSAKMSDLKALFSGSGSLADRISQKASTMYNQSTNQLAVNQGKMMYTRFGKLI